MKSKETDVLHQQDKGGELCQDLMVLDPVAWAR